MPTITIEIKDPGILTRRNKRTFFKDLKQGDIFQFHKNLEMHEVTQIAANQGVVVAYNSRAGFGPYSARVVERRIKDGDHSCYPKQAF